jgi:dCTP deaminase
MILADHEISRLAEKLGMLSPFTPRMTKQIDGRPCLGFGLDSAGYDLRLADKVRVFSYAGASTSNVIDPKAFDESLLVDLLADKEGKIILPPMTTALGKAVEHIRMPNNVAAVAFSKSTYARCGITLNTTKFVPGWEGDLVLEISNITPFPAILYVGEGIMSVVFFWVNPPDALYAQSGGSYQNQKGVTPPRA